MTHVDVIDSILGQPGAGAVAALRSQKPELAVQMQDYYDAVFRPSADSAATLPHAERWLIAIRTASHTRSQSAVDWYSAQALNSGVGEELITKANNTAEAWNGDPRTTAIMRHVDLIVTHPVDSSKTDIEALANAELSSMAIVALSQVVAYVSYQVRLIATLRALGAS